MQGMLTYADLQPSPLGSAAVESPSSPKYLIASFLVRFQPLHPLHAPQTSPNQLTISTTVGQAPFFSNITQHTEYLPVSVDILAAKGCDGIIFKLAQDLVKAGILNATQAGQTIYGWGDFVQERVGKWMAVIQ